MTILEGKEYFQVFVDESKEHMIGIENDLLSLESKNTIDHDLVAKVYRKIHSIKGGAGFLGLENIKELTHSVENVLALMKEEKLLPYPEIINILLDSTDILSGLLDNIEKSNEFDISELLVALKGATTAYLSQEQKEEQKKKETIHQDQKTETPHQDQKTDQEETFDERTQEISKEEINQKIRELKQAKKEKKREKKEKETLKPEQVKDDDSFFGIFKQEDQVEDDDSKKENDASDNTSNTDIKSKSKTKTVLLSKVYRKSEVKKRQEALGIPSISEDVSSFISLGGFQTRKFGKSLIKTFKKLEKRKSPVFADNHLRVNLTILDALMALAGELVLSRNQLVQAVSEKKMKDIENTSQKVDLITSELQEMIMATRMQPIGTLFRKFQRVVRDIAKKLGKEVMIILDGEEVELDKSIIEAMNDPLTHLIRNAIDHGIETIDERKKLGKKTRGTLILGASYDAGQVVIEITDDGAGIDPNKIREKAVNLNLYDSDTINDMSDKEVIQLIFVQGFSLAEEISDLSGRGIGMDVVKNNITKLGGNIEIDSFLANGTSIKIRLPLTLAIISSQIIYIENECYAIPQENIVELIRIPKKHVRDRLEFIGDNAFIRLRKTLLPVIWLQDVLNIKKSKDLRFDTIEDAVNILVLNTGDINYGLVADTLLDFEEIVVKPLGRHIRTCKCYSGATVLGDGKLAIILDVRGIAALSKLYERETPLLEKDLLEEKDSQIVLDETKYLLVNNAPGEQFVIPLELITRIEKVERSLIEEIGGLKIIKYNKRSLPVFYINDVVNVDKCEEKKYLHVIVVSLEKGNIGILASRLIDILDSISDIDEKTFKQKGVKGSVVVNGKTSLLINTKEIVSAAMPKWTLENTPDKHHCVLIAEDSEFFIYEIKEFLENDGYDVITAKDGQEALEILEEEADKIDVVLTDIEMPNLDGYGLAQEIKKNNKIKQIPIIALTSVASFDAEEKAKNVGIDEYLIKLDKDQVLQSIHSHIETHVKIATKQEEKTKKLQKEEELEKTKKLQKEEEEQEERNEEEEYE